MSVFVNAILTVGVIITLVFIYRKSDKAEGFLILKLIGYYFLGAFRFNFNTIAIPLGFLIYLLAFHPQTNIRGKRAAALLGLVIFILGLAIPKYNDYLFTRPIEIKVDHANIFDRSLDNDWISIRNKLKLDDAQVQNLLVDFERDGKMKYLRLQMIANTDQQLVHYTIEFLENRKTYVIYPARIDQQVYNYNLVSANELFDQITNVNLKEIMPKGEYSWCSIMSQGYINIFDSKNKEGLMLLTRQGIKPLPQQQYPIHGLSLTIMGMAKTSESPGSSLMSSEVNQYIITREQ